jgi:hypothetical protein
MNKKAAGGGLLCVMTSNLYRCIAAGDFIAERPHSVRMDAFGVGGRFLPKNGFPLDQDSIACSFTSCS